MDTLNIVIGVAEAIGIMVSILIAFLVFTGILLRLAWYISGRLTGAETSIKILGERFTSFEARNSETIISSSPIKLTEKGERILEKSGLKKYIDDNGKVFCNSCEVKFKMSSPYDVQVAAFEFFNQHLFSPNDEKNLKLTAYEEGVSDSVVRRIGGIYFRDFCLKQKKMSVKDIDNNK